MIYQILNSCHLITYVIDYHSQLTHQKITYSSQPWKLSFLSNFARNFFHSVLLVLLIFILRQFQSFKGYFMIRQWAGANLWRFLEQGMDPYKLYTVRNELHKLQLQLSLFCFLIFNY
jgi:hypothetical protein